MRFRIAFFVALAAIAIFMLWSPGLERTLLGFVLLAVLAAVGLPLMAREVGAARAAKRERIRQAEEDGWSRDGLPALVTTIYESSAEHANDLARMLSLGYRVESEASVPVEAQNIGWGRWRLRSLTQVTYVLTRPRGSIADDEGPSLPRSELPPA